MRNYFYLVGRKNKGDNVPIAHKLHGSPLILEGEYQIEKIYLKPIDKNNWEEAIRLSVKKNNKH